MERNTTSSNTEVDTFTTGDIIDEKFTVKKKLGRGGYGRNTRFCLLTLTGEIYWCTTKENNQVALKVERVVKPGNLREEELILKALQGLCLRGRR